MRANVFTSGTLPTDGREVQTGRFIFTSGRPSGALSKGFPWLTVMTTHLMQHFPVSGTTVEGTPSGRSAAPRLQVRAARLWCGRGKARVTDLCILFRN
jgi:hypothetical protein